MRTRRKSRTDRRQRAQDGRRLLDRYRRGISDETNTEDLADLAALLSNLVMMETDGRATAQVNALWTISRELRSQKEEA